MSPIRLDIRNDGVAVITIDHPPVNALSRDVRIGLMDAIDRAEADARVKALVLIGERGFIAGADITEFGTPRHKEGPSLRALQDRLEGLTKPVVAALFGNALGGGLELALACHGRVAAPSARLGLPEVKLGLLPGAGGTVRLPRLIGPEAALDIMISGKPVSAARALELGMVEAVDAELLDVAVRHALHLAQSPLPAPLIARADRIETVDPGFFDDQRKAIARKARGQSAPFKIIDCVERACTLPAGEALDAESAAFGELVSGDQHRALKHYFFAEREARRLPGLEAVSPLPIRRAGVVGAGLMGGGIAMVFANAGVPVTLLDRDRNAVDRGLEKIRANYDISVSRGSMKPEARDRALSLIRVTTDYADFAEVDIAVEAVFEDLAVKSDIFRQLDVATPAHAILATNTSALDIDRIAEATTRPDKVVGAHFFSPANVMKLLENVRGAKSSPETLATVMALGRQLGKIPVLAGNCDGFIGNRILNFYSTEAEFLLEDGATPEQVDRVAEAFGMPMGPLAMRDLIGFELSVKGRAARKQTLAPGERLPEMVERLLEAGRLGQKNGLGFYRYEGRNRIPDPDAVAIIRKQAAAVGAEPLELTDEEVRDRLFMPLVNEGARELEEGVALRASDIDVVWVNGYGFPAHRGGPMFWGEAVGLDKVLARAEAMAAKNGPRWAPAPLLRALVAAGKGWKDAGDHLPKGS
jgi:3-hydroxyacyl-CoA dehydrogenase